MLLMKVSVLSLKEKRIQHWFSDLQIDANTKKIK